jgi:error-prone DNA polymerase
MYAELHCHSTFSLLDGAAHPEQLVARAVRLGMPALALTDRDDLGGAVRFSTAAATAGLKGIIGVELTIEQTTDGGRRTAAGTADDSRQLHAAIRRLPSQPPSAVRRLPSNHSQIVLLAENREGYGNLSTLITRARLDHPRGVPRVSLDTLARHTNGLFALTGSPRGWVAQLAARGEHDAACEATAALIDMFDRRVAIECWDHSLPEERATTTALIEIAHALGIPWVVANDVRYADPAGRLAHDVLCALKHGATLDEMGTRLRPNGEWYLKGAAQMARRWQGREEGLRATLAVAERCTFRLADLKPTLPSFPLPDGVSEDDYLAQLVEQGARERWGWRRTAKHDAQLTHELTLIGKLGLAGYFLIVWDIVRFARRDGVLCQGRGSAANSAVCYVLGITAVDPIKLELLFERFLSEERKEAPDIDIDFAHRDRERVLQYVYERYGREHAAMVCEHITWRGRSAVRDAARVLGFSPEQAGALAMFSDRFSAKATAAALRAEPEAGSRKPEAGSRKPEADPFAPERADANGPAGYSKDLEARRIADVLGMDMMKGTHAVNRMREERAKSRAEWMKAKESSTSTATMPAQGRAGHASISETRPQDRAAVREGRGNGGMAHPTAPAPEQQADSLLTRAGLDPKDPRVIRLAEIVHGLHEAPRHRGIHVGGFVLTKEPLSTVVPIEPASMDERTVIQWEKDDLDPVGLVKIDLLGLGMLTAVQDCLKYIRATRGVSIDLGQLDFKDQAVYDDLCRADTVGVFQVESRAQMNTLPRLKPRCFYDLVVEVALIRPGPIQGEMVHPYLRRKNGEEPVTYPHPMLEPVLKRTLGVPLFQEQGMQVAIVAANFTPGEADLLRKAMGHKRSREKMEGIRQRMLDGMLANGISNEVATRIFNQINGFADYGFPESHAASFALIVYASAYLRHYYAPEFLAAMLNAQPMGFYSAGTLVEDAKRHGVRVLPVDVTRSAWDHTLECADGTVVVPHDGVIAVHRDAASDGERSKVCNAPQSTPQSAARSAPRTPPLVRLGLRSIRGLGSNARGKIERALSDGPFTSIRDVVHRSQLDRRALRFMAESGAFDAFVADEPPARRRRVALWRVLECVRGDAGPLALFPETKIPAGLPPLSAPEMTEADYRMTGLSLNGHPMRHLRALLLPNGVLTAHEATKQKDGARIAAAGLVICRQRPGTAKGFVFLTLEDETGMLNVVITPQRFEKQAPLISRTPLLLVRGVLQIEQTVVNLKAEEFVALGSGAGAEHARSHDFY